jgi:hypothetical protein
MLNSNGSNLNDDPPGAPVAWNISGRIASEGFTVESVLFFVALLWCLGKGDPK